MSIHVKASGTWKECTAIYVNNNGTWKQCKQVYVNDNGTWRPCLKVSNPAATYTGLPSPLPWQYDASATLNNVKIGSTITITGTNWVDDEVNSAEIGANMLNYKYEYYGQYKYNYPYSNSNINIQATATASTVTLSFVVPNWGDAEFLNFVITYTEEYYP